MDTEVIKIDPSAIDEAAIRRASELIKSGDLVVFPTETVYGLGADATNVSMPSMCCKAWRMGCITLTNWIKNCLPA